MRALKTEIEQLINKKGYTKELIYNNLGMTRQGFEYSLKNETLKVTDFAKLVKMLAIDVNTFFETEKTVSQIEVNDAKIFYGSKRNDTKIDTKIDTGESEVDFLRSQVQILTRIIENLSSQIDTKNIKD